MNQFINDMVHLTEGEKLVKYWWLWLAIYIIAIIYCIIDIFIIKGRK
jgi:hypothetical protein